jgi:hypothetical protein
MPKVETLERFITRVEQNAHADAVEEFYTADVVGFALPIMPNSCAAIASELKVSPLQAGKPIISYCVTPGKKRPGS